jgi:hypothetical protein
VGGLSELCHKKCDAQPTEFSELLILDRNKPTTYVPSAYDILLCYL